MIKQSTPANANNKASIMAPFVTKTVNAEERLVIKLDRGGILKGRVLGPDGEPPRNEDWTVMIRSLDSTHWSASPYAYPDAVGRFAQRVAVGRYRIEPLLESEPRPGVSRPVVVVRRGETVHVEVRVR